VFALTPFGKGNQRPARDDNDRHGWRRIDDPLGPAELAVLFVILCLIAAIAVPLYLSAAAAASLQLRANPPPH